MRNKNITTILIMAATLVLAGIAIFTAIKLYQTRQGTIAPTAPTSNPAAASNGAAAACQTLAFTLTSSSPTPTPTGSTSPTPTPTPTPTPVPQCGTSCSTNSDCPSAMICYVGACRNPSCTTSNNCICESATPSPTPTPAPGCYSTCTTPGSQDICPSGMTCTTVGGVNRCVNPNCSGSSNCVCATATPIVSVPTTTPSLPTAGSTTPTILGILGGGILLILGIVLVL